MKTAPLSPKTTPFPTPRVTSIPIRPGDLVELLADHTAHDGETVEAGQRGECVTVVGRAAIVEIEPPARQRRDGEPAPLGMQATVPLAKLRRLDQSGRLV